MDRASLAKEIKARLPLSKIVGERVELKGRSPSFTGLCPFHNEKTPSFHVRDNVARFKCFGCGLSGDVFEFLMRLRGISFAEAIDELAIKAGLAHRQNADFVTKPSKEKDSLFAQKVAQEYFALQLLENPVAMNYVQIKRGLSERMIKQAGLGFGGFAKEKYLSFLKSKGLSDQILLEAGLVKEGRFSLVPPFLNRITFPIRNADGIIVAFGGRAFLDDDGHAPKYVNTHSYKYYEKRKSFYGWFESKAAVQKGAAPVLVEGYFDAMAIWALGRPAVALCGTALTIDHVKLLRSFSARLILCFDRDSAGQNALRQALALMYRMNIEPSVALLDEKDAGDYLSKKNLDGLRKKLDSLTDAMCYVIDQAAILAQESVSERVRQIDALLPIFVGMKRPLVRRQYAAYLAKSLHEEPSTIWSEIAHKSKADSIDLTSPLKSTRTRSLAPHDRLAVEIALSDPSLIVEMDKIFDHLTSEIKDLLIILGQCYADDIDKPIEVSIQKALQQIDADWWPPINSIVQNKIVLTTDEARSSLNALENKLALQTQTASIKKKRLELEGFWRKRDYPSVLSSLKEKSELLASRKSVKKLDAHESASAPAVPTIDKKAKDHKITDLGISASFFDAAEDW